jgi:hypothetical protein
VHATEINNHAVSVRWTIPISEQAGGSHKLSDVILETISDDELRKGAVGHISKISIRLIFNVVR